MTDPSWPAQQAAQQASQQQAQDEQRRAAAEGHRLASRGSAPTGSPRRIALVIAIIVFVLIVLVAGAFILTQFAGTFSS
jgi:hypothetical protein